MVDYNRDKEDKVRVKIGCTPDSVTDKFMVSMSPDERCFFKTCMGQAFAFAVNMILEERKDKR